jgi:hypothetical protein
MTNQLQGERRRAVRRLINGAGLLSRLLGRNRPHPATRPQPRRPNPDAVVDCAVYVDGQRVPGRPHYTDAYTAARRRRNAFVWLGLHDPNPAEMAAVGRRPAAGPQPRSPPPGRGPGAGWTAPGRGTLGVCG